MHQEAKNNVFNKEHIFELQNFCQGGYEKCMSHLH
jgi:hypothetical protein